MFEYRVHIHSVGMRFFLLTNIKKLIDELDIYNSCICVGPPNNLFYMGQGVASEKRKDAERGRE
jgi:hypothetical protein